MLGKYLNDKIRWRLKSRLGMAVGIITPTASHLTQIGKRSLPTTDPRLPTTKLIGSNSNFGAAALSARMTLVCYSFASASFTYRNLSSLSVDRSNSKIYTI